MNPFADEFMRSALLAGSAIAIAAGLTGYFIVLRNQVFTADALGHAAFTGGMGALVLGLDLAGGLLAGCLGAALLVGVLGGRRRGRDVAIGTVFAWVLGAGVLFLSLYTASARGSDGGAGVSVLFGSILGLQPGPAALSAAASIAISAIVILVARPLLFASIDPEVAAARGLPVRVIGAAALVLVAVTVAEAVQAVGALLVFALMVSPAATAQAVTARPYAGLALSAAIAVVAVWVGLLLAFYTGLPAGFCITALVFSAYVTAYLSARLAARPARLS